MSLDSTQSLTTPFDQAAFFEALKKTPCGMCAHFGEVGCKSGEEAEKAGADMVSLKKLARQHQEQNGGAQKCSNTHEHHHDTL